MSSPPAPSRVASGGCWPRLSRRAAPRLACMRSTRLRPREVPPYIKVQICSVLIAEVAHGAHKLKPWPQTSCRLEVGQSLS
eukprot:6197231-Pleurochrysis_carterae.AAC.3